MVAGLPCGHSFDAKDWNLPGTVVDITITFFLNEDT